MLVVVFAAVLSEKRLGQPALAAARMFFAVSLLQLCRAMDLRLFMDSSRHRTEEWILGVVAYLLALWLTFRVSRNDLVIIAGAHFVLLLLYMLGVRLSDFVVDAPLPAQPPSG